LNCDKPEQVNVSTGRFQTDFRQLANLDNILAKDFSGEKLFQQRAD